VTDFFKSISDIFATLGDSTWSDICGNRDKIIKFAHDNGLTEEEFRPLTWHDAAVAAWNASLPPSSTSKVTHISKIHLRPPSASNDGTTKKSLVALASAIDPTNDAFVSQSREELHKFVRAHVPVACYMGYNFSSDTQHLCVAIGKERAMSTDRSEIPGCGSSGVDSAIDSSSGSSIGVDSAVGSSSGGSGQGSGGGSGDNRSVVGITPISSRGAIPVFTEQANSAVVLAVFGPGKAPSRQNIKNLKQDVVLKLAQYLAQDETTGIREDVPSNIKSVKNFCVARNWKLATVHEDAAAAIKIAKAEFTRRYPEFQRQWKTVLREVHEIYGCFSEHFKLYFVVMGLLNFSAHYRNKHDDCGRFLWWCRCQGGTNVYTPAYPYCTEVLSGRGKRCQGMIPVFFCMFVHDWVLSKYMETALSRTIAFAVTSMCESYFHWLAIMIPKWQHMRGPEYILREAVAFLAYHSKKDEFVSLQKKLVPNKYQPTLIASNGQKAGVHMGYIFDALVDIFPDDPVTNAYVTHCRKCMAALKSKRLTRQAAQREANSNSALDSNLKLMPSELDTSEEFQQQAEVKDCPRQNPPFPFKKEDLHLGPLSEIKKLLEQVWHRTDEIKLLFKERRAKKEESSAAKAADGDRSDTDDYLSGEDANDEEE
jgi:hypothetical protein